MHAIKETTYLDLNKMSNLPQTKPEPRSDEAVKQFFDRYFTDSLEFSASQVDAVVGFFENRGFDKTAAVSTSIVLLEQAKLDSINIFQLLDTLKGLSDVQLSEIVTEILNYKRPRTSSLGFREAIGVEQFEQRNVAP
jgi:hypothetical protein